MLLRRRAPLAISATTVAARGYVPKAWNPFYPKRGQTVPGEDELPPPPETTAKQRAEAPAETSSTPGSAFRLDASVEAATAEQYKATSAATRNEDGTDNWRAKARQEAIAMHLPAGKPLTDWERRPQAVNDNFRLDTADDPNKPTPKLVNAYGLKSDFEFARMTQNPATVNAKPQQQQHQRPPSRDSSFRVSSGQSAPSESKFPSKPSMDSGIAFAKLAEAHTGPATSLPRAQPVAAPGNTGRDLMQWGIGGIASLLALIAFTKWEAERTPPTMVSTGADGRIASSPVSPDKPKTSKPEPAATSSAAAASEPKATKKPDAKEHAAAKPRVKYVDIEADMYAGLGEDYVDCGHIARGEEPLVMHEHVFAQYGIITPRGVEELLQHHVAPAVSAQDVFVDIGSGIGNIVLQVLVDTPCQRGVGVEMLPSRVKESKFAYLSGASKYPDAFDGKVAAWLEGDVIALGDQLKAQQPSVIFTHSWMFDDDLMAKLSDLLAGMPHLRCIVTSRPLKPETYGRPAEEGVAAVPSSAWTSTKLGLEADWNPAAPFYVYHRRSPTAATTATTTVDDEQHQQLQLQQA